MKAHMLTRGFTWLNKIEQYIRLNTFSRPTLVLDVDQVEENYKQLKKGLGSAHIHYAVKANPQKEILERLVHLGSRFDAASMGEIVLCIDAGANQNILVLVTQ
jgi:ornithine decarboxylase